MSPPRLSVVQPETASDRLRALQEALRDLAAQQTAELIEAVQRVSLLAGEAIEAGIAKEGVLDMCRVLKEDMAKRALTLAAIEGRR